uniref:Chalcone synthase 847 n=1 Tax=Pohlia nutans TaxID=140635 RepID=A0A482KHG0_9BRYO|nr:chalcone synthase 847 [Pohlia nutans]
MAPPTDQFASAPNPNSLWTETDQAKYHEAPADPSRSCVLGLGTANPETGLSMEDFGNMILDIYGYQDVPLAKSFVERVAKASGIKKKQVVASYQVYKDNPCLQGFNESNLGERFRIYEPATMETGQLAAERALSDWGGDRDDITHLITYSTSMLLSPSLDLRLLRVLNLKPTVKHFSVSLLGCHGGVNGIRTAAEIAQADPNNRVLAVFVEINSVAAQTLNPANPSADLSPFLVNMLFGDGSGAVVVGKHPTKKETSILEVHRSQTYLIPDSSTSIGAILLESGMHTTLEKNVPLHVAQHVGGFVTELLHNTKLSFANVNWACHPGGKGILDAVEKSCKLKPEQLQSSRHILGNYGNMGATTVLFVLDKLRRDKKVDSTIHPWTTALSFGPGITVEGLLMKFGS